MKLRSWFGNVERRPGLLDYSAPKYGVEFVEDVRSIGSIIVIYIPVVMFWACYNLKDSYWQFQANHSDLEVAEGYAISPLWMSVINGALILVMMPMFNKLIYPGLGKKTEVYVVLCWRHKFPSVCNLPTNRIQ